MPKKLDKFVRLVNISFQVIFVNFLAGEGSQWRVITGMGLELTSAASRTT
jgi:hypothetical protein